jgi:acetyltransferase-like isoleucine patch superfamily enzyme
MTFHSVLRDIYDIFRDIARRSVLCIVNLLPGSPGNRITEAFKRQILKIIGVHIGIESQVSSNFYVFQFGKIKFGNDCSIGSGFKIWNFNKFTVGEKLLASHNITVICGTHTVDKYRSNIPGPVSIGSNVWIGANTLIVGPAVIGNDVIIGANSFVTGEIKSGWVYAGTPARPIKMIHDDNN